MHDNLPSSQRAADPAGGRKDSAETVGSGPGRHWRSSHHGQGHLQGERLVQHTWTFASLDKHRVSTYCVPGMLLGFGDAAGSKRDRDPHPRMGLTIQMQKQTGDKCVKTQARYLPMMRATRENQGEGCSA